MHNCYYYIILIILLIKIYAEEAISYRIDQTLYLINEQMITSCISKRSLIDYYTDGIEAISLDPLALKEKVNNTLDKNLPSSIEASARYYFYDCITMQAYRGSNDHANSVQILITFKYQDKTVDKYLRYQLVETL